MFFVIAVVVVHKDRVTPRFNEGITFLLSLALIYWFVDKGWFEHVGPMRLTVLIFVGIMTIFSTLNALLPIVLSPLNRLFLSLWTSVVALILAGDNLIHLYAMGMVEDAWGLSDALLIGSSYFLLGISAVYIAQNAIMLLDFPPPKTHGL